MNKLGDTMRVKQEKQNEFESGSTFRQGQSSMRQSYAGEKREGNHIFNLKTQEKQKRE